jgi:single stranded DNA-binding protein (ssb)
MLNNVILIGKITDTPILMETRTGKKFTTVTIAVERTFKNIHGIVETDFVSCKLWSEIAKNAVDFCEIGDLISVKGRLQTRGFDTKENIKVYTTEVIVENIKFLNHL